MKQRIIAILCILVMVLSLSSCSHMTFEDDPTGEVATADTPVEKEEKEPQAPQQGSSQPKKVEAAAQKIKEQVKLPENNLLQIAESKTETDEDPAPEDPDPAPPAEDEPAEDPDPAEELPPAPDPLVVIDRIIMPAELLPALLGENQDLNAFCKKNGFISASYLEDGSLAVMIEQETRKLELAIMQESLKQLLDSFTTDDMSLFFNNIRYTDDFSKIQIYANPVNYQYIESEIDQLNAVIFAFAVVCQIYAQQEVQCEIFYLNMVTSQTLHHSTWRDYLIYS